MDDALARISWPVRTERLTLRRVESADAGAAWRWRSLPEVSEWITTAATDPGEFADRYLSVPSREATVMIEYDGRLIGDLMLRVEDAWGQTEVAELARDMQAELGWTLDPAYGGQGLATEAVRAAIELCFSTLGVRRIIAQCFAANEPSWRLMERLGMRREQYAVQDSLHRSGEWMDGLTYALLASEWLD
jgi:RimJ/RimL family protein N-acetyltransferase